MITKEQYEAAVIIINEYLRENEEDDFDCQSEEDFEEDRAEREYEKQAEVAATCKCGAWQFNKKGDVIHVADCCCGAE